MRVHCSTLLVREFGERVKYFEKIFCLFLCLLIQKYTWRYACWRFTAYYRFRPSMCSNLFAVLLSSSICSNFPVSLLAGPLNTALSESCSSPFGSFLFTVLAQLALSLCVHPIVKNSRDGDSSVLLAGAVAAAIGVAFGKHQRHR